MNKLIALAIIQALLSAGAPKSELSLDCHTVALRITGGKKPRRVTVEACQVFVTQDRSCQATFDFKRGFIIRCESSAKSAAVETI